MAKRTTNIVTNKTDVSTGSSVSIPTMTPFRVYQCFVVGTGAVTATVNVEGSINGTDWEIINTFTLSGTTRAHGGYASNAPWPLVRANVTAISGTDASVNIDMAV